MRADNYQKSVKIVVTSGPASEPVTLAECKTQLRVDYTDEDTYLTSLITPARELAEDLTARRTITRTEKLLLDFFPEGDTIVIPVAPVSAVGSVSTVDEDGVATVFAASNYVVDTSGSVARIVLKNGACWPTLPSNARPVNAVEIVFTSGYANAGLVPSRMKLAIKLLVGHYFENREDTTPLTIKEIPSGTLRLLTALRVWEAIL